MILLVCGGRNFGDRDLLYRTLDRLAPTAIIHGAARGADRLAEVWAHERGIKCDPFPAAWRDLETPPVVLRYRQDGTPYNAAAGGIRNQAMIDLGRPDMVVAFPGNKGTADCVRRARAAGIKVMEVV